jgi:competence protein ComEC
MRAPVATAVLALCTVLASLVVSADGPLQIHFIDTEGGQATLLVTPSGESVLIDAGYGPRGGRGRGPVPPADRDANRIVDAARVAGISRIDYLIVTHFHPDHAGGVTELAARMPIGTFVDYGSPLGTIYGPDRMSANTFATYEAVRAKGRHLEARPGEKLPLRGLDVTFVSAGGRHLMKPLAEAGQTNSACTALEPHPEDGTENFRSVGVLFKFGAFRFLDLGDLSGMTLTRLACPKDLIGRVSVMVTPHHGDYDASVPALYAAIQPRVVVMNNGGARNHGGFPEHFQAIRRQASLEDLWQIHRSVNTSTDNSEDGLLANIDDGQTTGFPITLTASEDGSFALTNARTSFTKTYPKRPVIARSVPSNATR